MSEERAAYKPLEDAKDPLCIWWLSPSDVAAFAPPYETYRNSFTLRAAVALSNLPFYVYAFFLKMAKGDLPFGGYRFGRVWYPRDLSIDAEFDFQQQAIQEPQTLYSVFGNSLGLILPISVIAPPVQAQHLPGVLTNFAGEIIETCIQIGDAGLRDQKGR